MRLAHFFHSCLLVALMLLGTSKVAVGQTLTKLALSPVAVTGGSATTCTVTLSTKAGSSGTTISISSSSASAFVPKTVIVPRGAKTATFAVTTTPVQATTSVVIQGTLGTSIAKATLTIYCPKLATLSFMPSSVVGGGTTTGTVVLNSPAPSGGISASLTASDIGWGGPASITVAAGGKSANFTCMPSPVSATKTVRVTAKFAGSSASASLTIKRPTLVGLTLNPTLVGCGTSSTGTIHLDGPAPAGGLKIAMSSNLLSASVPKSITVSAGSTSTTFLVATTKVAKATTAKISASMSPTTVSAPLMILPAALSALTLNPTTVIGGASSTGTVTLTGPAPTGGVLINLSETDSAASVPSVVTVPAGQTSAVFAITTQGVSAQATATISASFESITLSATLTINPITLTFLSVAPTKVVGGANSTGTVTLNYPAPEGGISVNLNCDSSSASVPVSVTVAARATTATFTVSTLPVSAQGSVSISATLGASTVSAQLSIDPASILSLTLNPLTVTSGYPTVGTVTLTGIAPPGGYRISFKSNQAVAQPPASIVIPPGSTSATFSIATQQVSVQTAIQISATDPGNKSISVPFTLNAYLGLANSAWPKFRQNLQNTAIGVGNGATGQILWENFVNLFELRFASSPCIGTDGSLYVGSYDGHLYAFNSMNGAPLWSFAAGAPIESSPALGVNGILYFGCDDGKVYAVLAATGELVWTYSTGDQVQSSPSISPDGTVYICSNDHKVYALDATTGSLVWSFTTSGTTTTSDSSSPTIGPDGTIFVGVEAGSGLGNVDFYALDGKTGVQKWAHAGGGYIGTPAVANGLVYTGSMSSMVEALDSQTGELKWSVHTNLTVASSIAVEPNGDVVASSGYQVYRFNGLTGAKIWTFSITDNAYGQSCSPTIAPDGTVYVSMHDGVFYALNGDTGAALWQYGIGVADSSPVIGPDGTVYISGGYLIAFH